MNEAKFTKGLTKGDWKKCTMAMSPGDWAQLNSGKYPITIVCRGADVIAAVWGIEDEDEQANANLIAAAPDMYEAAEMLMLATEGANLLEATDLDGNDVLPKILRLASGVRRALAKARGETALHATVRELPDMIEG